MNRIICGPLPNRHDVNRNWGNHRYVRYVLGTSRQNRGDFFSEHPRIAIVNGGILSPDGVLGHPSHLVSPFVTNLIFRGNLRLATRRLIEHRINIKRCEFAFGALAHNMEAGDQHEVEHTVSEKAIPPCESSKDPRGWTLTMINRLSNVN